MCEFSLGKDCDKSVWEYFKSHWIHFFPTIPDRSNFVRQVANLHVMKRVVQERLAIALGALIDGLPMSICNLQGLTSVRF